MLTDIYGDDAQPMEWRWIFRGGELYPLDNLGTLEEAGQVEQAGPTVPEPALGSALGGAFVMSICTDSTRRRSIGTVQTLSPFFSTSALTRQGSPVDECNDSGKSPLCPTGQVGR